MTLNHNVRWLAVALGVVLGAAIALTRALPNGTPSTSTAVVATNVVASMEAPVPAPPKWVTNKVVVSHHSMAPSPSSVTNHPQPRIRKPIANDPKIPKARQVLLANRRVAIASGRSFPKKFCATQTPTRRGTAPYVVISERPVSRDVRIQAVADGAKVIGFLPNNALLVEADPAALKNLEEDALFTAAVEYEPTDKIQQALLKEAGATVEATVVLLNEKDTPVIRDFVTDNGGVLLCEVPAGEKRIRATLPRTLIEKLAGKAEVKWIERHARMRPLNDLAVQPVLMNVTPVRESPLGLTGEGQIVTTSDTGVDTGDSTTMHADLSHAIIGMDTVATDCHLRDTNGHGTHTAGSIVGDGTLSDGQIRGTAYGAKLFAWCMCDDDNNMWTPYYIYWLFQPSGDDPAYIHSASWGMDDSKVYWYGGWYSEDCYDIDLYIWYYPEFLPVWAAGNAGRYRSSHTVLTPATAKNILSVGASQSTRYDLAPAQIAEFSSCGPCLDGRIKPDVVAPGTYIRSTRSSQLSGSGDYLYMSGTSMATPLTAGTAALVREWLVKHREKANPSAALVKAVMTGGAADLSYESGNNALSCVPDARQGWGRVNMAESVTPTNGLSTLLVDWLPFTAGTNFTFRMTTTNVAPLSVQLVWVDAPSMTNVGRMLVNDLDLCVVADSQQWWGNGGRAPDEVNNVESVRIREATATSYTVRVRCSRIPYDHTEGGAAALYVRGAFDPATIERDVRFGTVYVIR